MNFSKLRIILFSMVSVFLAADAGWAQQWQGKNPLFGVYCGGSGSTVTESAKCGVDMLFITMNWYRQAPWLKGYVDNVHKHGMKVYPNFGPAWDGNAKYSHEFARKHPEYVCI